MKTTSQIAADCGMIPKDAKLLDRVLNQATGSKDPYQSALEEIIGALYRRVEHLDEICARLLAGQMPPRGGA